MKMRTFGLATALLASTVAAAPAHASMLVQYFTVQGNGRDFSGTGTFGSFTNAVGSKLGSNGLPTIDPSNNPMNAKDYNTTTKELNWWTPGATAINVMATGSAIIASNTFSDTTFFPTNGAGTSNGGSNGFQTAIFSGSFFLDTASSILFSIRADDDAFLFVDGVSALQNGGIHAATTQDASVTLGKGAHSFRLFYADRQQTDAALTFSLPNDLVITPSVPEPATWAMMIFGFGAVGSAMRRRKVRTSVRYA